MHFLKQFLKSVQISEENIPKFAKLLLMYWGFSFFMD